MNKKIIAVVGAGVTVHEGTAVAPKMMVDEDVVKEAK